MANQEKDRDGQQQGGIQKQGQRQQGKPGRTDRNQQGGDGDAVDPDKSGLTRGGNPEDLQK